MISIMTKTASGIMVRTPLSRIDESVKEQMLAKFKHMQTDGSLESEFNDDVWIVNNQLKKFKFNFGWRDFQLEPVCQERGIDYRHIIDDLKIFIICQYYSCGQEVLRESITYIINELTNSRLTSVMKEPPYVLHGRLLSSYIDFIEMEDWCSPGYISMCREVLNNIQEKVGNGEKDRKHPTELSEFPSYFIFDEIIRKYWRSAGESDKKIYFYPLYLFWIITSILPMRVMEFCVTAYDCLREEDGLFYLTIRRSRLKGSSAYQPKIHYYQIEKDYICREYEIPKWLYDEINRYKEITKNAKHPYGLLFSVDFMLDLTYGDFRTNDYDKVFCSLELGEIMTEFYADVICGEYGYRLVEKDDLMKRYMRDETESQSGFYHLEDKEVMYIYPKQTRHISMINLIFRGANPMLIKEFAGHESPITSANYYANITKTVRCSTRYFYDKARRERNVMAGTTYAEDETDGSPLALLLDNNDQHIEVDGGYCYSQNMLNHQYNDCISCGGNCENCRFFIRDKDKDAHDDVNKAENKLDMEMQYLLSIFRSETIDNRIAEYQEEIQRVEQCSRNLATAIWREQTMKDNKKEK